MQIGQSIWIKTKVMNIRVHSKLISSNPCLLIYMLNIILSLSAGRTCDYEEVSIL